VVTAHYDDSDAQDAAEIAAGENPLGPGEIRERSSGLLVEPDQLICERIQNDMNLRTSGVHVNGHDVCDDRSKAGLGRDTLRRNCGFRGMVISDSGRIGDHFPGNATAIGAR